MMPISSDGTLRIPRPEPVAYDDDAMEDMAVEISAADALQFLLSEGLSITAVEK